MNKEEIEKVLNFDSYYENEELDIDLFDDVLLIEDELIPKDRINKLLELLTPLKIEKGELIYLDWFALDSAIILTSWGYEEGLEYLKKIIFYGLKNIPNYSPHRIHNYNQSYEHIINALLNYNARMAERGNKIEALKKTSPLLIKLIDRAKEEDISLSMFKYELYDEDYYLIFKIPLENVLEYLKNKKDKTFLDEYNIKDIEIALTRPNILDTLSKNNE